MEIHDEATTFHFNSFLGLLTSDEDEDDNAYIEIALEQQQPQVQDEDEDEDDNAYIEIALEQQPPQVQVQQQDEQLQLRISSATKRVFPLPQPPLSPSLPSPNNYYDQPPKIRFRAAVDRLLGFLNISPSSPPVCTFDLVPTRGDEVNMSSSNVGGGSVKGKLMVKLRSIHTFQMMIANSLLKLREFNTQLKPRNMQLVPFKKLFRRRIQNTQRFGSSGAIDIGPTPISPTNNNEDSCSLSDKMNSLHSAIAHCKNSLV